MTTVKESCSCGCSPCVCPPVIGQGCVAEFCPPRPCFFPGQLVTAEDLNAVMTYFYTKQSMLAKLVAGWGIMGGMRLGTPGTPSIHLAAEKLESQNAVQEALLQELFPNPQVVAGPRIHVSEGAAIDNAGRLMALCADRVIDVLELSQGLGSAPVTRTCREWLGAICGRDERITAVPYWVIAEHVETPSRPVPKYAGGGACDPAPSCDFSRKIEAVRIRLVKDLPLLFFLHGCLDPTPLPLIEAIVALGSGVAIRPDDVGGGDLIDADGDGTPDGAGAPAGGGFRNALGGPATLEMVARLAKTQLQFGSANQAMTQLFGSFGFKVVPQVFEYINELALKICCANPAVALGRVLIATDVPDRIREVLGDHEYYTYIDDAFPYRRLVPNGAMLQTALTGGLSLAVSNSNP